MSLGLFDVLGPVMHGPSSSHTAGAARIGYYARQLMGQQPKRVQLGFHPAYMPFYRAQQSHTALIAGCLGIREHDTKFVQSLELAQEQGLTWTAIAVETEDCSRNTMRVTGWIGDEIYAINGISVGGGGILVDHINGVPVFLDGNDHVALFFSKNLELTQQVQSLLANQFGSDVARTYTGSGADGRTVVCMCLRQSAPEQLPPPFDKAVEEGLLSYHPIRPIYDFCDTGAEPLFTSFAQIFSLLEQGKELSELAIEYEMRRSGVSHDLVLGQGRFLVSVIRDSLARGEKGPISMIGGFADATDGEKLLRFAQTGRGTLNASFTTALARAVILAQMNAAAMRVVACPTGGAAGCTPAVIITAAERYEVDDDALARAFLVAALIGVIIGGKASFSGTVGGCQAEVGIGAAMGAAAVAWLAGGSGEQAIHAGMITMKNLLGLSCDPPTPATEVPCIKRNAMGVAAAFFGAEMALAGITSVITPDDIVVALADTQKRLPSDIKFGGKGGLASTCSGKILTEQWNERIKNMQ